MNEYKETSWVGLEERCSPHLNSTYKGLDVGATPDFKKCKEGGVAGAEWTWREVVDEAREKWGEGGGQGQIMEDLVSHL